ncbi:L,D-transpeptidase [Pukyongiella litopenaei]|uniref:L,D-transpeptidase n=1 Tax=Pukyongiella litopenaei TaxID=2605946 RepID=A0A5C2H2M0_9RHOB|nr:L,D-transpeptidase [Pukyongiella litopenaei]QEP30440.1 L,D-transpeptidase [Pukyongiella litopenaei]
MKRLTRRNVVTGMAAFGTAAVVGAEELAIDIANMLPGEFAWHPERAPSGPVAVIASIPEQRVHVYRNGLRIAVSTCSTGKTGHETPTGVFTVLQKDKHHRSSTYNNAPMPNMNRLTWDGIALHAGNLPGYPASHGCIRLPLEFSEKLFGVTHLGTPVIIAGARTDPWELIHPGLLLGHAGFESDVDAVLSLKGKARPTDWTDAAAHPVSTVLVTADDRTVTVIENSQVVASGPLTIKGGATLGEHVFVLNGLADGGLHWSGITHHPDPANPLAAEETVLNRLSIAPDLAGEILARKHVGMTMILSDLPVSPDRRSGEDFVIMDGRLLQSPLPHDRPAGLKRG